MTTLTLDPTQRLNIIAGLDRVQWPNGRDGWEARMLQHKLDLDDEERIVIGWRKVMDENKREYAMWSNAPGIPPRNYEFQDDDIRRILKAIDEYPVVLGRDKGWWEPLYEQLLSMREAPPLTPNGLVQGAMSGD